VRPTVTWTSARERLSRLPTPTLELSTFSTNTSIQAVKRELMANAFHQGFQSFDKSTIVSWANGQRKRHTEGRAIMYVGRKWIRQVMATDEKSNTDEFY
jgi:hypothetical protein